MEKHDETIRITKLEGAKRQLIAAIKLYFSEDDPVAIRGLVGPASQVLRDINKKRAGDPQDPPESIFNHDTPEGAEI
jgi:hypothetical protein